jgi:hypothetical protein
MANSTIGIARATHFGKQRKMPTTPSTPDAR